MIRTLFQQIPQDTTAFKDKLSGSQAFYAQPDYVKTTRQDFLQDKCLAHVDYMWDSEGKITRTARRILTPIILPWGIYESCHVGAGWYKLLPSSDPSSARIEEIRQRRLQIPLDGDWKCEASPKLKT